MECQGNNNYRSILSLPPGFRFHPTDEELVVQYLKRKALSSPLPASVIPEIDLKMFNPWDLPGEEKGEQYYFNHRGVKGKKNRVGWYGYWKAIGHSNKPIYSSSQCNQVVGMKRGFVFYRGKYPNGSPTQWIMHELCLANCHPKPYSLAHRNGDLVNDQKDQREEWVVCRISKKRLKRDGKNKKASDNEINWPHNDEFSNAQLHCSSSTSCVIDVSEDGEEETSDCVRYPFAN